MQYQMWIRFHLFHVFDSKFDRSVFGFYLQNFIQYCAQVLDVLFLILPNYALEIQVKQQFWHRISCLMHISYWV